MYFLYLRLQFEEKLKHEQTNHTKQGITGEIIKPWDFFSIPGKGSQI